MVPARLLVLRFRWAGLLECSEPEVTSNELSDGLCLEAGFKAGFGQGFSLAGLRE